MRNLHKTMLILCSMLFLFACNDTSITEASQKVEETFTDWENLLDKDLSHWDTYLSFKHQLDYDGTPPRDASNKLIEPLGLNPSNGHGIFTAMTENGEDVIRVGGEYYGCIVTKKEYANYQFQLKFKWGEEKWVPRKEKLKDSGILYHSVGPHGADYWKSWMMSQEFQIMEGYTGDYWKQATSAMDVRAYKPESVLNPLAHESQDFLPIGENQEIEFYCQRSNNYENKHGEWNTLDLITFEDKALHIVNGEVVMILRNSRYYDEDNNAVPLTKGKIQLQAEAAELFYKDFKIRTLDELPAKYQTYF